MEAYKLAEKAKNEAI